MVKHGHTAAEVMCMDPNTPLPPSRASKGRPRWAARTVGRLGTWMAGASRSTLLGILAGVVVVGGAAYAAANLGGFHTVKTTAVPTPTKRRHPVGTPTPPATHPMKAPTSSLLRLPVAGAVEAPFGWVYTSRLAEWYYNPGVTLKAKPGETVHAGWAGTVAAVGTQPLMGLTVEVNDGDGFTTFYGNLARTSVKVGQWVDQGASIGTVAAPSLYTRQPGSHVDFQVFQKSQAVDPANFLKSSS